MGLAFAVEPVAGVAGPVGFAGVFIAAEARDAAGADRRRPPGADRRRRPSARSPAAPRATLPTIRGVAAADLNYDYLHRSRAGRRRRVANPAPAGRRQVRRRHRRRRRLPASMRTAPQWGVWVADIDTEGDLDLVVSSGGRVDRRCFATTATAPSPRRSRLASIENVRAFAWLDLDDDLVPDAVVRAARRDAAGLPEPARRAVPGSAGEPWRAATAPTFASPRPPAGAVSAPTSTTTAPPTSSSRRRRRPRSSWQRRRARRRPGSRCRCGRAPPPISMATGDSIWSASTRTASRSSRGTAARRPTTTRSSGRSRRRCSAISASTRSASAGKSRSGRACTCSGRPSPRPSSTSAWARRRSAEVARIFWPNGTIQSEFQLTADATIAASQRLKGSCPWLFAWNGREMAFVTDLIWRSPLGLRINAQATADIQATEDWVKVRGDQLVARDGAYDLRVTAELWETHFFDRLALGYVDHPAGTEVFVDERFAVPAPPLDLVATDPVRAFCVRARRSRARRRRRRRRARRPTSRFRRPRRLSGDHARPLRRARAARGRAARRPAVADRARMGASHRQLRERRDLAGRACRAEEPVAAGRGRVRHDSARCGRALVSRRARTRPSASTWPAIFPRDRAQAPAARHQSRSVLGPARLGGRPAGRAPADGPAAASSGRLALPWVLGDRATRCQHPRAAALHAGRHGAALARSRGVSHAVWRRDAAGDGHRRPLRDHERGRRAGVALRPGAAAAGRAWSAISSSSATAG